jgi:hypothetical protein
MKTVIVITNSYRDLWFQDAIVFSSTKKLLEYYQQLNPRAKNLRVKETPFMLQVLNHNTSVTDFNVNIRRVKLDEELE